MRLSTRAVSLLSIAALTLPVVAGAAAKITLRDVISIVQTNKKPLAFDIAMRSSYGATAGTFTVKGVQNGDMKTLSKAAAEATVVIEASDGTGGSGRADIHVILAKETLYVRLKHVEAKGPWKAQVENLKPYDQWYSFPIDPNEYEAYFNNDDRMRTASLKEIEAFFSIAANQLRNGKTQYVITVPKAKQRRLLSRILGPNYARTYNSPSIDVRLMVDAMKQTFDAMAGSASIKATIDGQALSVTLSGNTRVLSTTPRISAPEGSIPWKELIESQGSLQTENARNAQRKSDVNTILNAVYQYAIDHDAKLPQTLLDAGAGEVGICKKGQKTCDGISLDILTESYIVFLPVDPLQDASAKETGYRIRMDENGRVTVSAPLAENSTSISVTR